MTAGVAAAAAAAAAVRAAAARYARLGALGNYSETTRKRLGILRCARSCGWKGPPRGPTPAVGSRAAESFPSRFRVVSESFPGRIRIVTGHARTKLEGRRGPAPNVTVGMLPARPGESRHGAVTP